MVAQVRHVFLAGGVAARVGRTHVGGDLADNVVQRHFVVPHLEFAFIRRDLAEVQVCPGVRCNLMAFRVHALDCLHILISDINLPLANIVASDKESSFCVVTLEDVKDVGSEFFLWAIVIGECNGSRLRAIGDTQASIWDGSKPGARN
jgi:hypothetical protein